MQFRIIFLASHGLQAVVYALYLLFGVDWHGSVTSFQAAYLSFYRPGPLATMIQPSNFGIGVHDWLAGGLFTTWLSPLPGLILYSFLLSLVAEIIRRVPRK